MKNLRALYFPYARVQSTGILNNAILLFDEITIISPDAFISNYQGDISSHSKAVEEYLQTIKMLVDENVVRLVNPSEVVSDYGDMITEGVIEDLFNQDFLRVCEPYSQASWTLSARKLPQQLDGWLRNLFQHLPEMARDQILPRLFGRTGNVGFVYKL